MIKKLTTYIKNFKVSTLTMILMLCIAINATIINMVVDQGNEVFINHVSSVMDTFENQRELNEAFIGAMIRSEMIIVAQQKRLNQLEETVRHLAAEHGYK